MKSNRSRLSAALFSCLALAGAAPAFAASAAPAPSTAPSADPALVAGVDQKMKDLRDGSDDERQVATDWLLNTPRQALPLIEAASARPGFDADTRRQLTDLLGRLRHLNKVRAALDQSQQEEYEWNLRTALEAYDRVGRHDPKWDDLARQAIRGFVSRRPAERAAAFDTLEHITSDLKCNDPLVLYLDARALEMAGDREPDPQKQGRRYGQAMDTYAAACTFFEKSDYPADRKCFALTRPVMLAYRTTANQFPKVKADAQKWADAAPALWPQVVKVPGISARFLLDIADLILQAQVKCGGDRGAAADRLFPPFEQAFPDSPAPGVMKGRAYTDWAWDARGGGYANTVTPEGWKKFHERLAVAADALQKSYDKDPSDPRAAVAMMHVELGQGRGRPVMEKWFKRATEAEPDATLAETYPGGRDAYGWKLEYLQKRWYGNDAAVLDFGRECLATRNWVGRVTWVLVTAHLELARNARLAGGTDEAYFQRPAVWKDIEEVVGGRTRMWPKEDYAASACAYWAWKCAQWGLADQLFNLLGNRIDPAVFGGALKIAEARAESSRRAAAGR